MGREKTRNTRTARKNTEKCVVLPRSDGVLELWQAALHDCDGYVDYVDPGDSSIETLNNRLVFVVLLN